MKTLPVLEQRYDHSLDRLVNEYPSDKLFLHPVKLSKWHFGTQD